MAKRASSGKSGVVISQEILALVQANKAIKGPEVMVALREKFPKESFNEASCQVAYANARKKLGLTRTLAKRPGKALSGQTRLKPVTPVVSSAVLDCCRPLRHCCSIAMATRLPLLWH